MAFPYKKMTDADFERIRGITSPERVLVGADAVGDTQQGVDGGASRGEGRGGGGEDHDEITDLMEVGHHIADLAVKAVGKGAVVKGLVLVRIPHPVPEKKAYRPWVMRGKRRHQMP